MIKLIANSNHFQLFLARNVQTSSGNCCDHLIFTLPAGKPVKNNDDDDDDDGDDGDDDDDDDDFSLSRAIEEFDLWTSKKLNTTQTVEERNKVHLELAIAAFKHATNAATRATPLPHLMQRIHDTIMEGPPEWRQIFDDARKYFAPK